MGRFPFVQRIVALTLTAALGLQAAPPPESTPKPPPFHGTVALALSPVAFGRLAARASLLPRRFLIDHLRRRAALSTPLLSPEVREVLETLASIAALVAMPFGAIATVQLSPGLAADDDRLKPPSWVKRAIHDTGVLTMDFMLEEGQLPRETDVWAGALETEMQDLNARLRAASTYADRVHALHAHGFREIARDNGVVAFARAVDGAHMAPALPAGAPAQWVAFIAEDAWASGRLVTHFHPFSAGGDYENDHIYTMNDPLSGRCNACLIGHYARHQGFAIPLEGDITFKLFRDATVFIEYGEARHAFDPSYMDQLVPAKAGAVVAAQSIKEPPYWYVWARDTALLVKAWAHQALDRTALTPALVRKLADYVRFQNDFVLTIARLHANGQFYRTLGEGKIQADNQPLQGRDWSKQKDGPPLKVTALVDIADTFIALGADTSLIADIWNVVVANLTYVVNTLHEATTDIWEENFQPSHFYTRLAQYRGLKKGVALWNAYGRNRETTVEARGVGQRWDTEAEQLRERMTHDHVKKIDAIAEELARRTGNGRLIEWVARHAQQPGSLPDFMREVRAALDLAPLDDALYADGAQAALRDTLAAIPPRFGLRPHYATSHSADGIDRGAIELYSQLLLLIDVKRHLADTVGWARAGECPLIVASVYYDDAKQPVTQRVFDSAIIGAVIHNMEENTGAQRIFDADDPAVITTFLAHEYISRRIYPVNDGRPAGSAVWDTRYPGDIFNGAGFSAGNPWVLTTCWSGRYLFYLSRSLLRQTRGAYPEWIARTQSPDYQTALSLLFREERRDWPLALMHQRVGGLMRQAVDCVMLVRSSIQTNGAMYEEVDRVTGEPRGARNLAWSFREWNRLLNDWERTFPLFHRPSELELFIAGIPGDSRRARPYFRAHRFHPRTNGDSDVNTLVGTIGTLSLLVRLPGHRHVSESVNGYTWVDLRRGALWSAGTESPGIEVLSLVGTGAAHEPTSTHDLERLLIALVRNPAEGLPQLANRIESIETAAAAGEETERLAFIADLRRLSAIAPDTALLYFGEEGMPVVAHIILALRRSLGVDTSHEDGLGHWFHNGAYQTWETVRSRLHDWPAGRRLRLLQTSNPNVMILAYGDIAAGQAFYLDAIPLLRGYAGKLWGTISTSDVSRLIGPGSGQRFDVEDVGHRSRRERVFYHRGKPDTEWLEYGFPIGVPAESQSLRIADVSGARLRRSMVDRRRNLTRIAN